jgi:hypothetical protein
MRICSGLDDKQIVTPALFRILNVTRYVTLCIFTVSVRFNTELSSQKDHHVGGGTFLTSENPAGEFQIGKMDGEPQSIGVTPSLTD